MLHFSYKNALLNKNPKSDDSVLLSANLQLATNETEKVKDDELCCNIMDSSSFKKVDPLIIPLKIKKKANQIFVKKDSIPLKEDIIRLCSHGMYMKIKNIHNSHFTEENMKFYIHHMHKKIDEIKGWKKEEKNKNESSQKRFKIRIDNIYKTINVMKEKHLEHISDTIVQDEILNGKWEKVSK